MDVGKGKPPEHSKFKPGQTGNPNGRPVKLFSEIAAEWKARGVERATPERVIETFEYLLAVPFEELREMASGTGDNAYPAIVQIAAEEMTGKRKLEIMRDMLDRAHGKSMQRQQMSGDINVKTENTFSSLPLEKQIAILKLANEVDE